MLTANGHPLSVSTSHRYPMLSLKLKPTKPRLQLKTSAEHVQGHLSTGRRLGLSSKNDAGLVLIELPSILGEGQIAGE